MGLSVLATILAVIALAVSFVVPGPTGTAGADGQDGATGAQGPQGPQGPAGPGTLMTSSTVAGGGLIAGACTNFAGAEVTIAVPGPGTVVVTSQVRIFIDHATGTQDLVRVFLGTTSSDCAGDEWRAFAGLSSAEPTGTTYVTVTAQEPFPVSAGTYTYYVNADMFSGVGGDTFYGAGTIAVFYPS